MKIKIKLTARELAVLTDYLHQNINTRCPDHVERLIHTCLAELLHQLQLAALLVKQEYKIQVSVASGLAFCAFSTSLRIKALPADEYIINKLIGIIDQKTI